MYLTHSYVNKKIIEVTMLCNPAFMWLNPLASIGRTGTSKGKVKVKVRDICLNISFLTWFFSFFTPKWKKVQSLL